MQIDLDHAHLFASDIDETVRWWTEMLGAHVVFDLQIAGARNIRLAVAGVRNLTSAAPGQRLGQRPPPRIQTGDLEGSASMEPGPSVSTRDQGRRCCTRYGRSPDDSAGAVSGRGDDAP
jgi:catechol 2,3-dioxygenase-like lactoylglutathione lyase family enzyme